MTETTTTMTGRTHHFGTRFFRGIPSNEIAPICNESDCRNVAIFSVYAGFTKDAFNLGPTFEGTLIGHYCSDCIGKAIDKEIKPESFVIRRIS